MHRPPPEKKRLSIPEVLMTLVVAAALIAGIYAVYKLAMRDKKVDAALAQVDEIRQLDMTSTDGNLKNPWEGTITSRRHDGMLSVTLESVPVSACLQLAEHYTAADENFIKMTINSHIFGEGAESPTTDSLTAACAEKNPLTISWDFQ